MKFARSITVLVITIVVLSALAASYGVFAGGGPGSYQFESLRSGEVTIYGEGLYKYESLNLGPQARGQDVVTLFLWIPLLLISLRFALKHSLKGKLMLTGTIGYFLYTYMMYTAIQFNEMFIVYIALMACSLFAFILSFMALEVPEQKTAFGGRIPVMILAIFQVFSAFGLAFRWLSDLLPALLTGSVPEQLQHYSSIPVYSMDLGLAVPAFILAAVLILKRTTWGYVLTAVLLVKAVTMWTALIAMTVAAAMQGVEMGAGDIVMAPVFNVISIVLLVLVLKNIQEPLKSRKR